jgi:hypothetical protein
MDAQKSLTGAGLARDAESIDRFTEYRETQIIHCVTRDVESIDRFTEYRETQTIYCMTREAESIDKFTEYREPPKPTHCNIHVT